MMKLFVCIVSALACLVGVCAQAQAEAYDIVARYQLSTDKGTETIDLSLLGHPKALPQDSLNGTLQGIFMKGMKDQPSRALLASVDGVVIRVVTPNASPFVPTIEFAPADLSNGDKQLLGAANLSGGRVPNLTFQVNLHYSDSYLCQRELEYRLEKGQDKTTSGVAYPISKSAGAFEPSALSLFVQQALVTADDKVIYATLCPKVHAKLDVDHLSFRGKSGTEAYAEYKRELVAKLHDALSVGDNTVYESVRASDVQPSLYYRAEHAAPAFFDNKSFVFKEVDESGPRDLGTVVDKNSNLVISPACCPSTAGDIPNCGQALSSLWSVRLDYENDKKTSETASLKPEGSFWRIDAKLTDHVGEPVTITILQKLGSNTVEIAKSRTVVQDLGLITTFPVVTDVVAAISKNPKSVKDLGSQSSLPVSWAIDLANGHRSMAAVTFPWMLGWNTRGAPDLAKYFKVFPHVSVIVPLKETNATTTPIVALGGGVAIASAFTFSVGATVTEETSHALLLLGISVTDIAKVVSP